MDIASIYKHSADALLEEMDGELLLYHPPSAVTLHLNGPSAVVWQLIDGQRSVADIVALVVETYPDQADQIAGDVNSVMSDLVSRKVIHKV